MVVLVVVDDDDAAAADIVDTVVDGRVPVIGTLLVFVDVPVATATVAASSVPAAFASLFFLYFRDGRKRSLNDGIWFD